MKINAISNILASIFFAITSILLFPIYLNFLGPEKYGFFTFFFVISIYFRLLDFGTSATLTRFVALKNKEKDGLLFIRKLVFSYEIFFLILSLLIVFSTLLISEFVASKWITSYSLSTEVVSNCLIVISIIISLRFFIALYRGALNGFEFQLWLNILRISIEFICFYVGILIYYLYFDMLDYSILYLFIFFCLIYFAEFIIARVKLFKHLRYTGNAIMPLLSPFKETFKFSLMIMLSTSIWIFITWSDKIIWSSIFDLKYYGYFVSLTIISSSSLFFITPINTALLAGFTRILSKENFSEIENVFYKSNLISLFIILSIATIVISYPKQILYAWTGNSELSEWGYKPMISYTIGYSVIAVSHTYFTYASSLNKLYHHTILSLIWGLVVLISFILSALYFNIFISGVFWTIANVFFVIIFVFIFFTEISPQMNYKKILTSSIKTIALFTIFIILLNFYDIDNNSGRFYILSQIILILSLTTLVYLFLFKDVLLSILTIFKSK